MDGQGSRVPHWEYKFFYEKTDEDGDIPLYIQDWINGYAIEGGWRLHSIVVQAPVRTHPDEGRFTVILERQVV